MAIKSKREPLVYAHLEDSSRALLEHHSDIVRKRIGKNPGLYALYKGGKLYYVGLASSLSARLRAHLRDRHKDAWDQFAIYLTIKDQHIKELESLLLRIARPKGNAVSGNPKGSHDMAGDVRREVKEKKLKEWLGVVGGTAIRKTTTEEAEVSSKLSKLFPHGAAIRTVYKGSHLTGRIRRDGTVRVDGQLFGSLSMAAKHICGAHTNGWRFWSVERGAGNWIKADEGRKAGTPLVRLTKAKAAAKRARLQKRRATKEAEALQARRSENAKNAWKTRRMKAQ